MKPANHLMPTNLNQICYKKAPSMIESVVMRLLQRNPRYRIVIGYRGWSQKMRPRPGSLTGANLL